MSQKLFNPAQQWEKKKSMDSRQVEKILRQEFPQTDAYRYNSASIRVRIVDPRFANKSAPRRDSMVEPWLNKLPPKLLADIMNLLMLAPSEQSDSLANLEFEDPSRSSL